MVGQRACLAFLVVALVAACGSTATPPPSQIADAGVSPGAPASLGPSAAPSTSPSPSPSPTATPTATPEPTATPTPTPAPTPVPWKTYTSKRYHYKMKYPPTWIVTPGSATVSDSYDNFGYPYIYVSRDTVTGTVSISRTVTTQTAYYKSHFKAKLLSNVAITLAGWSGRVLTFSGSDNGLKVIIKTVMLGKGHVGYFIDLFGDARTAVADRSLFRKIYLTWRPT